jgi:hypothetical protein
MMHRLMSRIICVVVVIEPAPIHSIAYIHQPATPTVLFRHCSEYTTSSAAGAQYLVNYTVTETKTNRRTYWLHRKADLSPRRRRSSCSKQVHVKKPDRAFRRDMKPGMTVLSKTSGNMTDRLIRVILASYEFADRTVSFIARNFRKIRTDRHYYNRWWSVF